MKKKKKNWWTSPQNQRERVILEMDLTHFLMHDDSLHRAASDGLASAVERILATDPILIATIDSRGLTALQCAAYNGHDHIVALFLHHSKSPNMAGSDLDCSLSALMEAVDANGWTVLHCAADQGHSAVVARILDVPDCPNLIDAVDNCKRTALHYAASSGRDRVVAQLLAQRPSGIHAVASDGWTALHFAAANGHENVVAELLRFQANTNSLGQETSAMPTIIEAVDGAGRTALHWAARNGHDKVVELLLAAPDSVIHAVDSNGLSALYFAVDNGHDKVVPQLLAQLGSSALSESPALHWAAHNGHTTVAAQLLAANGELIHANDAYGRSVLHYAIQEGHESIARMFLQVKPELIFAVDTTKDTILHLAIKQRGASEVFITYLWRLNPAALHTENLRLDTPFQLAVKYSYESGIRALQWGLCLDEAVNIFTACKRPCMKRFRPVVESQCEHLSRSLHQDVLATVYEYLGFEAVKRPQPKQ